MLWSVVDSPIGGIGVAVDAGTVCRVTFGEARSFEEAPADLLGRAVRELREYFEGGRTEFELPTADSAGTEFDRAVWAAIAAIPYGETRSYGSIARDVGDPSAAQAVGIACNRNPLPILVPCHRVIGADGKLVGFGGGLRRKRWLLELETRVHIERTFAP
jgi:methylated-DNA-[protein]-cysteine S-methyltransferase